MKTLPTLAIVGRPNVGKSSLFNRLLNRRLAIVDPTPGVTRDRLEAFVSWTGKVFRAVDTGGMNFQGKERMQQEIQRQVDMALRLADAVVFVVDGTEGPMPLDFEILQKLRVIDKPLILAVNKIDREKAGEELSRFYELGMDKLYPVSALHGRGIGNLLDAMVQAMPEAGAAVLPSADIKIAVLGKPNVGKSSFVNALLREERMVVDNKPGTTRDSVDVRLAHKGKSIILVDTAGIRRSKQWENAPEFYSVARAQASIKKADVIILMMDAMEGVSQQDRKLARLVVDEGKAMVICLNKWDLVHGVKGKEYAEPFFKQIPFADFAPLVYASALQRKNIEECLDEAIKVFEEAGKSIQTKALNKVIERLQEKQSHPIVKGKRFKIYFAAQTGQRPPVFTFFVNDRTRMQNTYKHYLESRLRDAFGFAGVPLRFELKNRR